jgi:hypothetical protein
LIDDGSRITRRSFIGRAGLVAAGVAVAAAAPDLPGRVASAGASLHVPGEGAAHARTWMAWPSSRAIWGQSLCRKPERRLGIAVGEQALASSDDERVDHEVVLVHEIVRDEALDEPAAAEDAKVGTVLCLEGADPFGDVARKHVRVLPGKRIRERRGHRRVSAGRRRSSPARTRRR